MKRNRILTLLALISAAVLSTAHGADEASITTPSQEEMWQMIQAQQKQIETLTAMVEANQAKAVKTETELASAKATASQAKAEASNTRKELANTQAQLEATTLAVEEGSSFGSAGWWEKTSVGGYGELHANFNDTGDNEIDFHRFVLFYNHDFNDWISLFSEFELEHSLAGDEKPGEVELEQAFIRMDWTEQFSTDAGVFLMPVGILNETHEPNTFYGIERNRVENRIIPTTWWEGGVKATYRMDNGLAFDGAITSGLDMPETGSSAYRIRSGRQKVAQAFNNEAAFAGRVKYTGVAGLEVAASLFYQDDMSQGEDDDNATDFSGLLSTAHVIYNYEGFTMKALYAQWDFSGNDVPSDAESQYGWYLEPSYRWNLNERYGDLGVFIRYSDYEYYRGTGQRENEVVTLGVNWWPTDNVVFKADFQSYDNGSGDNQSNDDTDDNDHSFNLGVGYQF